MMFSSEFDKIKRRKLNEAAFKKHKEEYKAFQIELELDEARGLPETESFVNFVNKVYSKFVKYNKDPDLFLKNI